MSLFNTTDGDIVYLSNKITITSDYIDFPIKLVDLNDEQKNILIDIEVDKQLKKIGYNI